jgi:SMC interacting uncharacterized protein involved in chromosome segregation
MNPQHNGVNEKLAAKDTRIDGLREENVNLKKQMEDMQKYHTRERENMLEYMQQLQKSNVQLHQEIFKSEKGMIARRREHNASMREVMDRNQQMHTSLSNSFESLSNCNIKLAQALAEIDRLRLEAIKKFGQDDSDDEVIESTQTPKA